MNTRERGLAAFEAALAALRPDPALREAYAALAAQRDAFRRRMAVSLVGRVSSGKSTLANALLGGAYAPTGIEELTYNVTWLRHGPRDVVTVHFGDGRPPERRAREELPGLATRAHTDPAARAYLAAVAYLEVTDPNPRLAAFDLVDTPGLDAVDGDPQTAKTLAFLGRGAGSVRRDTLAHAALADALVLVFPKAVSAKDAEVAAGFARAGLGAPDPVTAVGVLTKIEQYWPAHDPIAEGTRNAARLMASPTLRRTLYGIRPVAGKLAAAAALCTVRDLADLTELADGAPEGLVERLARSAGRFTAAEGSGLPLSGRRRDELLELFSGWGVVVACDLIRRERPDLPGLRARLEERSGLADLRALLATHFARRADVIKLRRAIDGTGALVTALAAGLGPRERDTLRRAAAPVTGLAREPAFRELAVLRRLFLGELAFPEEEARELARVCGEYGSSLAERLGAPPGTGAAELSAVAARRHAYWSAAVVDPGRAAERGACQVVLSAYDRLLHEAGTACRTPEGR